MQKFQDNQNQTWTLSLTVTKTRKLRDALGLDLLNPNHYLQVVGSLTDRLAFVYLLCEQQAKELEVSADEFEERLYGDGFVDAASNAFMRETESFFQRLGQTGFAKVAAANIQAMTEGQQALKDQTIGPIDSEPDKPDDPTENSSPDSSGNESPS